MAEGKSIRIGLDSRLRGNDKHAGVTHMNLYSAGDVYEKSEALD